MSLLLALDHSHTLSFDWLGFLYSCEAGGGGGGAFALPILHSRRCLASFIASPTRLWQGITQRKSPLQSLDPQYARGRTLSRSLKDPQFQTLSRFLLASTYPLEAGDYSTQVPTPVAGPRCLSRNCVLLVPPRYLVRLVRHSTLPNQLLVFKIFTWKTFTTPYASVGDSKLPRDLHALLSLWIGTLPGKCWTAHQLKTTSSRVSFLQSNARTPKNLTPPFRPHTPHQSHEKFAKERYP